MYSYCRRNKIGMGKREGEKELRDHVCKTNPRLNKQKWSRSYCSREKKIN